MGLCALGKGFQAQRVRPSVEACVLVPDGLGVLEAVEWQVVANKGFEQVESREMGVLMASAPEACPPSSGLRV